MSKNETCGSGLNVEIPAGGYNRSGAAQAIKEAGLPAVMSHLAKGAFGTSSRGVACLEALAESVDVGLAAAHMLTGLILKEAAVPGSFAVPEMTPSQQLIVSAFQIVVTADAAQRRLVEFASVPDVEGALELDGFDGLLRTGTDPLALAERVLKLAKRYLELHPPQQAKPSEATPPEVHVAATLLAFMELLERATNIYARGGVLRPLVSALASRKIVVAGHSYDGLLIREAREEASGLLPVWPEEIVGNTEYVQAGLRLARDVAGYDFDARKNPKRINPVLFGLGRPGCGKTVTAHAIGNYFLRYCRDREIPAKFMVIRRTDWASSYQNASALNLVRIFKDEVYGFDGVCGVYWADIDTALASRASSGLRMEEKQNLGAVFGVFDGTLLPRDGKWFLICDANTMHMDEAAVSRIAQNPFTVEGPTSNEHYVTLMRDLLLRDIHECIPAEDEVWLRLGSLASSLKLSGRAVDAICGNIRAWVQDFEYPEEYFKAGPEHRQAILKSLSKRIEETEIERFIRHWHEFQREAEERAQREQFESEVQMLVRQLNASKAAAERAVASLPDSTPPEPSEPPAAP